MGVSSVFQEVTLRMIVDEQERQWLLAQTSHMNEKNYSITELQNGVSES